MLRVPTSRRRKKKGEGLNLVPILDSVFIFIFFLLMSTQFIRTTEIASDVPIVSNEPPPKNEKKPLALTLTINESELIVKAGVPSKIMKRFPKLNSGDYDIENLHNYLIDLKKGNMEEKSIIFEPIVDITYEEIVKIMDSVRMFRKTDESLFYRDKDGNDVKIEQLFDQIIFGNLLS